MATLLIVDDNKGTIDALRQIIYEKGYKSIASASAEEALKAFKNNRIDLLITDMKLPGMSGLELLKRIKALDNTLPVIVITAFGSVEKAVEAVKLGAFDFVTKPFTVEEIEIKIDNALNSRKLTLENLELSLENEYLRSEFSSDFAEIIGESNEILDIFKQIKRVSNANSPVLILGESGTGKELIARAIHNSSNRKDKPFVRVNCAALSQSLLESELFGHEKGAFTGAVRQKPGRFEIARDGTIFLDEIGELTNEVQVKLLRVLQEKEFERVGGVDTIEMKARIITATHQNLEKLIEEGKFREDLYYRLNVIPINLPPLRERKEDIPLLVNHFIKKYSQEAKKDIRGIEDKALALLISYSFPGNIRELENMVERAVVMSNNPVLKLNDFPNIIYEENLGKNILNNNNVEELPNLSQLVEKYEKKIIREALQKNNGNISHTAKELGMKRTTLRYKMEKYGLIGT